MTLLILNVKCLERESVDNLINRIPGSRLLISSLPGSPLRTHVESLGKSQGTKFV